MPKPTRSVRTTFEVGLVPLGLSVATVVLGLVGWGKIDYDHSSHSALVVLFKALGGSRSASGNTPEHNLWTDAASVGGLLSVYSWFFVLFWSYLRDLIGRLAVRLLYHDHVVVIGDTPFARRAAKIWRSRWRRPLQLVAPDDAGAADHACGHFTAKLDDRLVVPFALAGAGHVLIDLGDDLQTLTLGFNLLSAVARRPSRTRMASRAEWSVVVGSVLLADHFAEKVAKLQEGSKAALPGIHYVNRRRLAVRYFMGAHPLFRMAERAAQERVHVLIVGFGEIGQYLAEISILTALAGDLGAPAVTVLTTNHETARRRFLSGRPNLQDAIDIAFLPIDALEDLRLAATPAAAALRDREATAPFTIAFLTEEPQENVRIALLMDDIHRKTDRLGCRLHSFEDNVEEAAFLSSETGKLRGIISGFETFDLPDAALAANLCEPGARDLLARGLHDRYAANEPPGSVAAWPALPESARRANRNAADQWRAFAHTLGFDIDAVPAGKLGRIGAEDAARLLAPSPEAPWADLLDKAGRLEHARWMNERRLDGWTYAETRCNRRKAHHLLVPWETLCAKFPIDAKKNGENVRAVVQFLAEYGDRRYPLPRRREAPDPPGPA